MALTRIDYGWNGQPGITMKFAQLSSNGRYALFEGEGDAAMGLEGARVFVRDLTTGKTETVAFKQDGSLVTDANASYMSADGRFVVYTSAQNGIVAGDDNNSSDVFRYDRVTGQTLLVSSDWLGGSADDASLSAGISADGRYVVFYSRAGDLLDPSHYTNGYVPDFELFVRDLQTGEIKAFTSTYESKDAFGNESIIDDEPVVVTGVDVLGRPAFTYDHYEAQGGQAYSGYFGYYISGGQSHARIDASASGHEQVKSSELGAFLSGYRHLPGSAVGTQELVILEGPKWADPIYRFELADGGRYVVFVADFDPATKLWDPGVYVWDLHVGPPPPVATGAFAKILDLAPGTRVSDLGISADGKTIHFRYEDNGAQAMSSGTYTADNIIWGGSVEAPGEGPPPGAVDPTDGADILFGSSTHETIHGLDGGDVIYGAAGDDDLYGDRGNDVLHGNVGDDDLFGGAGEDRLEGGKGDDRLDGGDDKDVLAGGNGADELRGGAGDDRLDGGTGNDKLFMDAGNDSIDGGQDATGDDHDTLALQGNAGQYGIVDYNGADEASRFTRIAGDETGVDEVRGIEQLTFTGLRTNAVEQSHVYLTLAEAADVAYESVATMGNGWRPLTALELGMDMNGRLADGVTDFTYANGVYSAIGPAPVGGFPIQAAAHVYFGVVDGKNTLMLAVRGTDSLSDTQDYPNFRLHAERFEPLIDAILDYVENGGYAEGGHIDQVYISGHSLGGATVQQIMADPRIAGNPMFTAATFGSPGSERHDWDPRIVHFEHSADPVPLSGDVARFAATGLKAPFLVTEDMAELFGSVLQGIDTPTDFYTAGSVVRLSTVNLTGVFADAQHSMTNYVESVRNFTLHPDKFAVLGGGAPAIPGSPKGHISVMVGSDEGDIMDGAAAPLIQLLRGGDYFDGSEIVVGGGGTDLIEGGSGRDIFAGTRAEHDNDMLADLSGGEIIRVYGAPVQQADVNYVSIGLDGGLLGIGGAIIRIGGFHSGNFVVKAPVEGPHPYTDIVYLGPLQLLGGAGDDTLAGGDGDDDLKGGLGSDRLEGGDGEDSLSGDGSGSAAGLRALAAAGEDGHDVLDGGRGADTMSGGAGQDRFVLRTDMADRITDFETGADVLDVTYVVAELGSKENPFVGGYLRLESDGDGGTRLIMDTDGAKGAGAGKLVATFDGVRPEDFNAHNFAGGVDGVDPTRTAAAMHGSHRGEIIHGTAGNDDIVGHHGHDYLYGGNGDDRIWGQGQGAQEGDASEEVLDPAGEPFPEGESPLAQIMEGGAGDDWLQGGNSFDWIYGGTGDDWIAGSYEVNRLYGEDGNDVIDLFNGNDTAWGGAGRDRFIVEGPASDWIMDFEAGIGLGDVLDLSRFKEITSFDQLVFTTSPWGGDNDTVIYAKIPGLGYDKSLFVTLVGVKPGDIVRDDIFLAGDRAAPGQIRGTWGNDRLAGTAAGDVFRMDDGGWDVVSGGSGDDVFYFGDAMTPRDLVNGGQGADQLQLQGDYSGGRALLLSVGALNGVEQLTVLSGADIRYGHKGDQRFGYDIAAHDGNVAAGGRLTVGGGGLQAAETLRFDGSAETDGSFRIEGGAGDDMLAGGAQADALLGGDGKDRLAGGLGADSLAGGAGDDVFVFASAGESTASDRDSIEDFAAGDRIDLSTVDADATRLGRQSFAFIGGAAFGGKAGELRASATGGDWSVEGDIDGDGAADFSLRVHVQDGRALAASDFVLGSAVVPPVAVPDSAAVAENGIVQIDVAANDIGTERLVAEIDGKPVLVGQTVSLASGATATILSDDRIAYDPNGAFDHLAGPGSGAANVSATDSFTYRLAGGEGAATVTIAVSGTASAGDRLQGSTGGDEVTAGAQRDVFLLQQGGDDNASGLGGVDTFYFGGAFTAADDVDGGDDRDSVILQGDYSAGITFGSAAGSNIKGIESVSLLSGGNGSFGDMAGNRYSYGLTMLDSNVEAAALMKVNGFHLLAGENFTFDGSAEKDAGYQLFGGLGRDSITGGAMGDNIIFGHDGRFGAGDFVDGGDGYDVVYLRGDYAIDFDDAAFAGSLRNVESIGLLTSANNEFAGGGDGDFDYAIDWSDAMLAAGATITMNGGRLQAHETFTFDGSRERDGHLRIFGGAGDDTLSGGGGDDLIYGGGGADVLMGHAGADIFRYQAASDSTAGAADLIEGFAQGIDRIDLSRIDANGAEDGDQAFAFIGSAAFTGAGSGSAGELRAFQVDENSNLWRLEGDLDGDGSADLVLDVHVEAGQQLTGGEFLL